MIDSLPSGATSASLAYQSVSVAVEDATRCSAIGPARSRGAVGGAVRRVRPGGPASRWSVGTYGLAATVPYWLKAMLKPAAGSLLWLAVPVPSAHRSYVVPSGGQRSAVRYSLRCCR